jgi:hypothetical protein
MWVPRGETPDHSLARSLAPLHSSALLICAAAFSTHVELSQTHIKCLLRLSRHVLFMVRAFELTMTVVVARPSPCRSHPWYRSVAPRQSLRRAQKDRRFQCARGTARRSTTTHSSTSSVRRDPRTLPRAALSCTFHILVLASCCFSRLSCKPVWCCCCCSSLARLVSLRYRTALVISPFGSNRPVRSHLQNARVYPRFSRSLQLFVCSQTEFDEEPGYAALMHAVEAFLSNPASDTPVRAVFTDAMHDDLAARLASAGVSDADLAAVARFWAQLRDRLLISGFLKDKEIGKKRLVSMPDRVSNTVSLLLLLLRLRLLTRSLVCVWRVLLQHSMLTCMVIAFRSHTRTHTHARTHAHTHTHTHTRTHTHAHARTHAHTHTHAHARARARTHTHAP